MIKPLQSITLKNDNGEDTTYVVASAPAIVETTEPASVASISDGAEGIPVSSLIADINPVQTGSGDPSPSNVRPITGWTGMNVVRNGFNAWDEETESGYINADGSLGTSSTALRSKNFCPCVGGLTYYFRKPSTYAQTPNICWYDADKTFISRSTTSGFPNIPAPSNARFFKISMWSYGTTYNNDISINYPSTDHDYHAYTGTTYPISWEDEAGTVYGGTLDVTNGLLTVTHGMIDMNTVTMLGGAAGTGYVWYYTLTNPATVPNSQIAHIISEEFPAIRFNGVTNNTNTIAIRDTGVLYVNNGSNTTQPTTKAVYELATPQTYQLTPQAVLTILGQNNIWADTGDVEVAYCADTKMYIDKMIAEL